MGKLPPVKGSSAYLPKNTNGNPFVAIFKAASAMAKAMALPIVAVYAGLILATAEAANIASTEWSRGKETRSYFASLISDKMQSFLSGYVSSIGEDTRTVLGTFAKVGHDIYNTLCPYQLQTFKAGFSSHLDEVNAFFTPATNTHPSKAFSLQGNLNQTQQL